MGKSLVCKDGQIVRERERERGGEEGREGGGEREGEGEGNHLCRDG